MPIVTVNNRRGHRGIQHVNLLICPNQGIVEFTGKDIPPVLRVVKADYEQSGKWSQTIWTVDIADDYAIMTYAQDWGMGVYFPVRTWSEAIERVMVAITRHYGRPVTPSEMTDVMIERAIRAIFPKDAAAIDAAELEFRSSGNVLEQLLSAQKDLADARQEEQVVT